MVQFYALTTGKNDWSNFIEPDYNDHLTENDFGYQIIEQLKVIYVQYLVDIYRKYLLNYEFNTFYLT